MPRQGRPGPGFHWGRKSPRASMVRGDPYGGYPAGSGPGQGQLPARGVHLGPGEGGMPGRDSGLPRLEPAGLGEELEGGGRCSARGEVLGESLGKWTGTGGPARTQMLRQGRPGPGLNWGRISPRASMVRGDPCGGNPAGSPTSELEPKLLRTPRNKFSLDCPINKSVPLLHCAVPRGEARLPPT